MVVKVCWNSPANHFDLSNPMEPMLENWPITGHFSWPGDASVCSYNSCRDRGKGTYNQRLVRWLQDFRTSSHLNKVSHWSYLPQPQVAPALHVWAHIPPWGWAHHINTAREKQWILLNRNQPVTYKWILHICYNAQPWSNIDNCYFMIW